MQTLSVHTLDLANGRQTPEPFLSLPYLVLHRSLLGDTSSEV